MDNIVRSLGKRLGLTSIEKLAMDIASPTLPDLRKKKRESLLTAGLQSQTAKAPVNLVLSQSNI